MKAFIATIADSYAYDNGFGDDESRVLVVWAPDIHTAVNQLIAVDEIDENYTGSHGPPWTIEELVAPAEPKVEWGPRVGFGVRTSRQPEPVNYSADLVSTTPMPDVNSYSGDMCG